MGTFAYGKANKKFKMADHFSIAGCFGFYLTPDPSTMERGDCESIQLNEHFLLKNIKERF
jgi:hypothetical protein